MQQSIDSPVDPPDEHVRRQESNRARQETIHGAGQEAVAEEQQTRHEASDVQVEDKVPHAVAKHPECAAATREEALPPPVVVLRAELAVGSDDCYFADRYHQDRRHGAQKAKHVVVSALVLPQVLEDKKKLNEQHREWTQAGQESPADAVQIPWLWRDLTRNGGRLGRMLPGRGAHVSVPAARIHQRHLDEQPESQKTHQRAERNGSARGLRPHEEVENEDEAESESREE